MCKEQATNAPQRIIGCLRQFFSWMLSRYICERDSAVWYLFKYSLVQLKVIDEIIRLDRLTPSSRVRVITSFGRKESPSSTQSFRLKQNGIRQLEEQNWPPSPLLTKAWVLMSSQTSQQQWQLPATRTAKSLWARASYWVNCSSWSCCSSWFCRWPCRWSLFVEQGLGAHLQTRRDRKWQSMSVEGQ